MLGKLLKYDLKDKFKFLIIFYSIALFFGVLTRIFLAVENSFIMNIIGKICGGTAISMLFNIVINNLTRIWVRFSQNLYGDESYLTHTLPVKRTTLYISKIITAFITIFVSVGAIALTLFTAYYSKENLQLLKNLILPLAKAYESSLAALILSILFILFLEFVNALQCGFTGIILGHKMNSAKTPFSVLYGFIAYIASQLIVLLLIFIYALFNKDLLNLFITNAAFGVDVIKSVIYISMILYSLVIIITFVLNIKLFKKGVNID